MKNALVFIISLLFSISLSAQDFGDESRLTSSVDNDSKITLNIKDLSKKEKVEYKIWPSTDSGSVSYQALPKRSSVIEKQLERGVKYYISINIFDKKGELTQAWDFSITP